MLNEPRWAAICAIRQTDPYVTAVFEPGGPYRFVGSERRLAERMAKDGLLLKTKDPNVFKVSKKGQREYDRYNKARK